MSLPQVLVPEEGRAESNCGPRVARYEVGYSEVATGSGLDQARQQPTYGLWPILYLDESLAGSIVLSITNLSRPLEQRSLDLDDDDDTPTDEFLTDDFLMLETVGSLYEGLCYEYSKCGGEIRPLAGSESKFQSLVEGILKRRISPAAVYLAITNLLSRMQNRTGQPILDPGSYFLRSIENMVADCDHFQPVEVITKKMLFLMSVRDYDYAKKVWFAG